MNAIHVMLVDRFLIRDESCEGVVPNTFELPDSVRRFDVISGHSAEIPSASQSDGRRFSTFSRTVDEAPCMSIPHRIGPTVLRRLTIATPNRDLVKINELHHRATTFDLLQLLTALTRRRPAGAPIDATKLLGTVTTAFGPLPTVRQRIVDCRRPGQPFVETIAKSTQTNLRYQREIHQALPGSFLEAEAEQQRDGHQRTDDPADNAVRKGDTNTKH
mmetsp:Transcript_135660/g.306940  ORF Transcript_135660/g.306940 Transcript_135660/m.306940 type:complete len:217 (-) Transcript_135660:213-863(-)